MSSTPNRAENARWRRLILLLASSLTVMAGATIAPALPALQATFSETQGVEWLTRLILTVPALAIAITAPLAGIIIDAFGRKRLIIIATLFYALTGTTGLWLDTIQGLLVGRVLLGITVGGIMTTASTLAGDYFSGTDRERFMGQQASFMALGGVAFLLFGGLLAEAHWRAPFALYALSIVLVPVMILVLYEPERRSTAQSERGTAEVLNGAPFGLMALLYGLGVIQMITFYTLPVQFPFHFADLGLGGPAAAGQLLAAATLAAAFSSLQFRRLRKHLSHQGIFAVCYLINGAGLAIVAMADTVIVLAIGMTVVGLGMGATFPNYSVWLLSRTPVAIRGRVVSGLTSSIFLGQFASPLYSQPLITAVGASNMYLATAMILLMGSIGFTTWIVIRMLRPQNPTTESRSR